MKRCAIYARYSSDLQSPTSIEDQEHLCRTYAERQGWAVVSVFEDAALSGFGIEHRSGYQQLLAAALSSPADLRGRPGRGSVAPHARHGRAPARHHAPPPQGGRAGRGERWDRHEPARREDARRRQGARQRAVPRRSPRQDPPRALGIRRPWAERRGPPLRLPDRPGDARGEARRPWHARPLRGGDGRGGDRRARSSARTRRGGA